MAHISFIYFRFNTFPEEAICVGMILIDDAGTTMTKLSDSRMKKARTILTNKHVFKMFKMSVTQLCEPINTSLLTVDYVDRLHRYQNGVIKIDKPAVIALKSLDDFEPLFESRLKDL
jgi:hypothetical protein